jgi:RHS repeat-associated protein
MPFLMKGNPMKKNTRHWAGITAAGILSLAGYASAATLGSEKYTYDASGNIIEKSIDGVVTKMAFDKSNRLTEFQTAGESKQTTTYDNAGRPVTECNADGQTTRSMRYGYADKVLETQNQNSKAGFYYNAEGQLVGKKTHGNVSTYAWDGNVLAADGVEAFANEAHITGGVPVLSSEENVVVSDHLGNTLASGEKQFASTAYGQGLERARFTGKKYVHELGRFVFNHRLYSPEISRWTVSDPAGFPDGINNNLYANGDPVVKIDPDGLTVVDYNTVLAKYNNSTPNCEVKAKIESSYLAVPQATSAEIVEFAGTTGYLYDSPGATVTWYSNPYTESSPNKSCYEFYLAVTARAYVNTSPISGIKYLYGTANGIDFLGEDTKTSWAFEQ